MQVFRFWYVKRKAFGANFLYWVYFNTKFSYDDFYENQKKRLPRSWCTINALWPSQRKNCKSRENARFGLHNVWLELKTSSYLLPHFCNFPPPFLLHGLVYVLSTCVPEVLAKSFECTIWQNFVPLVGIYVYYNLSCMSVRPFVCSSVTDK